LFTRPWRKKKKSSALVHRGHRKRGEGEKTARNTGGKERTIPIKKEKKGRGLMTLMGVEITANG